MSFHFHFISFHAVFAAPLLRFTACLFRGWFLRLATFISHTLTYCHFMPSASFLSFHWLRHFMTYWFSSSAAPLLSHEQRSAASSQPLMHFRLISSLFILLFFSPLPLSPRYFSADSHFATPPQLRISSLTHFIYFTLSFSSLPDVSLLIASALILTLQAETHSRITAFLIFAFLDCQPQLSLSKWTYAHLAIGHFCRSRLDISSFSLSLP